MIIFFGPAGSGKSTQAKLVADKMNWKHVSMGELLRQIDDPAVQAVLASGELVDPKLTNQLVRDLCQQSQTDGVNLVLDGYPRQPEQAYWLIEERDKYVVDAIIVIKVSEDEIRARLEDRAREDDTAEAIERRIAIFREETQPVIDRMRQAKMPVFEIDGSGTVEQTHQKIMDVILKNVATTKN